MPNGQTWFTPALMGSVSLAPRVLIVEDYPDTADLLGRYARLIGCETRTAVSGGEALRIALEFLPQIILLDIGLPDIDGWTVARTLREKLEPVHPVVIAITAFGSHEDRQRSEDAGIDHHLSKPEFRKELMELLMRLVGRGGASAR